MKRILIDEARCGITKGGFACGPVPGSVVASVKYTYDNETEYLICEEFDGFPDFFLSKKDFFDDIMEDELSDKVTEMMDKTRIINLGEIELGEYDETFKSIESNPDSIYIPLVRYLITLVRCKKEETDNIINMAKNKYADELVIPVSDVESEYYESL